MELTTPAIPIEMLNYSKLTERTPLSPASIISQKLCESIAKRPEPHTVITSKPIQPSTPSASKKLNPIYFPSTPFRARIFDRTSSNERLKVASMLKTSTFRTSPVVT